MHLTQPEGFTGDENDTLNRLADRGSKADSERRETPNHALEGATMAIE